MISRSLPTSPSDPEVQSVHHRALRRVLVVAASITAAVALAASGVAPAAVADTAPPAGVPGTVSTDALPTVQINGVVWAQVVIGNTVYVGGRFSQARPAGVGKGATGTDGRVARSNMLAYDITTGALIDSFAPRFNSEVRALAASADGSTVYAVGNFTAVDGRSRTRVAAVSATTGSSRYAGSLNSMAYAVAVNGGTLYVGGQFTKANGKTRTRLAAFNTKTGALRSWHPSANRAVQGLAVSSSGQSIVAVGHFDTVNGKAAAGSVRLSNGTGRSNLSWALNKLIGNSGPDAALYSVTADADYVYVTGYSYHPKRPKLKRLEGVASVTWSGGRIHWIEDCKGDTYSSAVLGSVVYTASHAHDCRNLGSFKETKPMRFNHSMAFTRARTGTLKKNTLRSSTYSNYGGQPAPSVLNWWPAFTSGTYTGMGQAAWSVTGNAQYVVFGGEFPSVNGVAQQGLVRFADSRIAPNTDGPRLSGDDLRPTVKALGGGKVRVAFTADFDRDNEYLTYTVTRTSTGDPVVRTLNVGSQYYFSRPTTTYDEAGLVPGTTYAYRITVADPFGNTAVGSTATVVVQ